MKKIHSLWQNIALSFRVIFDINNTTTTTRASNRFYVFFWFLALMLPSVLQVFSNKLYAAFIDRLGEIPLAFVLLGAVLLIRIGGNLFDQIKYTVFDRLARDADRKMSLYTIERISHLQQLDFDCADRFEQIKSAVNSELSIWTFNWHLVSLGSAVITMIGTFSIAITYRPILIFVALALSIPVIFLNILLSKHAEATRTSSRKQKYATEYYERMLIDPVRMKELKLFGETANMHNLWKKAFLENRRISFGYKLKGQLLSFFCDLLEFMYLLAISLVCAYDCANHSITLGDYGLHAANFALLFASLKDFTDAFRDMLTSDGEFDEFTNFTESTAHGERKGKRVLNTDTFTIRFEHVSFSYGGRNVLNDINFTWNSGESIALIGRNGSGKTTLIKLICGLYIPSSGMIYINDIPYNEYAQNELYRLFGVVYQDFCKFELTLRENIAAQSMDDQYDNSKISAALKSARLSNLSLSKGFDTELGRRFSQEGIELSGGEWQKIAISRNHFAMRKFRIYDEPASALDSLSENAFISNELASSTGGLLVISHRLSIGRLTNKVLLLQDGQIVESGSHDDLIHMGGSYAKMFSTQASLYCDQLGEKNEKNY